MDASGSPRHLHRGCSDIHHLASPTRLLAMGPKSRQATNAPLGPLCGWCADLDWCWDHPKPAWPAHTGASSLAPCDGSVALLSFLLPQLTPRCTSSLRPGRRLRRLAG